jgi:DNA-binding MarR family transcriptional regulator
MEKLAQLLAKLVEVILAHPIPEKKWNLEHSRITDPGEEFGNLTKVDQYLTDLNFFRDDAHVAAWVPYGVSGQLWEALTLIWRDEAKKAEDFPEPLLQYRGYTIEQYTQALNKLVDMGWLEKTEDGYQATEEGSGIRTEAEEKTDQIYYAAWKKLAEHELVEMYDLLTRLKEKLVASAEEKEAQAA